jgi:hypothetical protein
MQVSSSIRGVTGNHSQLSTRTILFSTRYRQALHVRDLDFVRLFHKCTYGGTGADSRVVLASAPALPNQYVVPMLFDFLPSDSSRSSRFRSSYSATV